MLDTFLKHQKYCEDVLSKINIKDLSHMTFSAAGEEVNNYFDDTDIAVIVAFSGEDSEDINRTKQMMKRLTEMRPEPHCIVFYEAQLQGVEFHFSYLKSVDNVVYRQVTLKEEETFIDQKICLWNLGAQYVMRSKYGRGVANFLFLDNSVYFVNQSILPIISEKLKTCDLIQPFANAVCPDDPDYEYNGFMSVAKAYVTTKKASLLNWCGLALAMTRIFYNSLGSIPFAPIDNMEAEFWTQIFSIKEMPVTKFTPYVYTQLQRYNMFPMPKIGYIEGAVIHIGKAKAWRNPYQPSVLRKYTIINHEEYKINANGLAVYRDTPTGAVCSELMPVMLDSSVTGNDVFKKYTDEVAHVIYGSYTESNPLIILYLERETNDVAVKRVQKMKELWDRHCLTPHKFICICNVEIDGVETIKRNYTSNELPWNFSTLEFFRKEYSDESTGVLCVTSHIKPVKDFNIPKCLPNTVCMLPLGKLAQTREQKSSNLMYYSGDFTFIVDEFISRLYGEPNQNPFFIAADAAECIANILYKYGYYVDSTDRYLDVDIEGNEKSLMVLVEEASYNSESYPISSL